MISAYRVQALRRSPTRNQPSCTPSHNAADRIPRPDSSFRSSTDLAFRSASAHTDYSGLRVHSLRSSIGLHMGFSWGSACFSLGLVDVSWYAIVL